MHTDLEHFQFKEEPQKEEHTRAFLLNFSNLAQVFLKRVWRVAGETI